MELLENLVLPVTGSHLQLLNWLLLLATVMFLVYNVILFGNVLLSVIYNSKATKENNAHWARYSRDLLETSTASSTIWFGFGFAPLLAIILLYTQLMAGSGANAVPYMIVSLALYAAAIPVIYVTKHSIDFNGLMNLVGEDKKNEEIHHYEHSNKSLYGVSAFWSVTLLLLSMWMFFVGANVALNSELWNVSFLKAGFSNYVGLRLLFFVVAAIAIGSVSFLFVKYSWDGGQKVDDEEYSTLSKKASVKNAMIATMFIPLSFGLNIWATPKNAISGEMFAVAAIGVVALLLGIHFVYAMFKANDAKYGNYAFFAVATAFVFFVAKEQLAFQTSNNHNVMKLTHNYEAIFEELHGGGAAAEVVIDGEEIYKTRCSACHKFEVDQATAPGYNNVLPKYLDNQEEMIKFILNPYPVQKDKYPAGMANQGLKSAEAKAVAEFLLNEYRTKYAPAN